MPNHWARQGELLPDHQVGPSMFNFVLLRQNVIMLVPVHLIVVGVSVATV